MFKLPESNLFSNIQPSGISILWPSLATTTKSRTNQLPFVPTEHTQQRPTNDSPTKRHVTTKVYISSDRQMIKFQDLGNLLEPLLELLDLFINSPSVSDFIHSKRRIYKPS